MILRSSDYAPILVEHLQRGATVSRILPRRRLGLIIGEQRYCYLILSGRVTVHRHSDDLTMATVTAPSLVGIGNLCEMQMNGYIKTLTSCDIAKVTMEAAREIIRTDNLWEILASHMMVVAGKLYQSGQQLSAPSAYELVRAQLYELSSEARSIQENITAERYIRDKTGLSRSGVMRILSALRDGGYVVIERGILVELKNLPEKF